MGKTSTIYRWNYPWMLVSRIRKSYISSMRVPNPTVESESRELDNYITRRHLTCKIDRIIYGQKHKDDYDSSFERQRLREKGIKKEEILTR